MQRFVIPVSEKKRRSRLIRGCLYIAFGILCIVLLVDHLSSDEERSGLRRAFLIVAILQAGWEGVEQFKKRKRKEFFLEIDAYYLKWLLQETGDPTIIDWNDMRWIKKEKNGGILIFRDSSFSIGFSLKDFQQEEQEQIVSLLEQYAIPKQIRLINFSEPSLAIA